VLAPSIIRPIIQSFELISCIFTLILFSNSKNTRYCQFTESQAGDGETGDITGEPGWGDVCPDSHLLPWIFPT